MHTGQQEYSARWLLITSLIILLILIPMLLCLAYIGLKMFRSYSENGSDSWFINPPSRSASRLRLNEPDSVIENRNLSPLVISDDDYTYKSPIASDLSSPSSSDSKKRRSYDRTYRTHEPLEGLPEIEFEEKPWDLESVSPETEYSPESKPKVVGRHAFVPAGAKPTPFIYNRSESISPVYTVPHTPNSRPDVVRASNSNPNLLERQLSYGSDDYASVVKSIGEKRTPSKSQSSVITEV